MSDDNTPNVEAEARALGWVPQSEFRGGAENWIDAETFLERGKTQLPILRENNRRLQSDVARLSGELTQLKTLFEGSQTAIVELKKFHEETFNARVNAEKEKLRKEIREARESGDIDAEEQAREKLTDLTTEAKQVTQAASADNSKTTTSTQPASTEVTPEYKAWEAQNPWILTDRRKSAVALGLAQELRSRRPDLMGAKFFDALDKELEEVFPTTPSGSKVAGARNTGGGGGGGGGKGYDSLPSDAKEVCDRQAKTFVGKGKPYETVDAWRKHYTEVYYQRDAS